MPVPLNLRAAVDRVRLLLRCLPIAWCACALSTVNAQPADNSIQAARSLQAPAVAPVTIGQGLESGRPALAADVAADRVASGDAIAQLRQFLTQTRTARGQFSQQTLRGPGRAPERASGVFAFERPGRFRWEVKAPFEQLMVADGEKLWFLDADLNQVIERKLSDSLGASPAAILFGGGDLERAFTLRESGRLDGVDWLEAVPKSRDAGFEKIAIGFRDGLPQAMQVVDAFGRTTNFTFSAVERNPALDSQLFRFVVPQGADLIRQ